MRDLFVQWRGRLGWLLFALGLAERIIGLGGGVDFILARWQEPGWVGDVLRAISQYSPIIGTGMLFVGLWLILWSERRRTDKLLSGFIIHDDLNRASLSVHSAKVQADHARESAERSIGFFAKLRQELDTLDLPMLSNRVWLLEVARYVSAALPLLRQQRDGISKSLEALQTLSLEGSSDPSSWRRFYDRAAMELGSRTDGVSQLVQHRINFQAHPNFDENPNRPCGGENEAWGPERLHDYRRLIDQHTTAIKALGEVEQRWADFLAQLPDPPVGAVEVLNPIPLAEKERRLREGTGLERPL